MGALAASGEQKMPRVIFIIHQLQEKHIATNKPMYLAFVHLKRPSTGYSETSENRTPSGPGQKFGILRCSVFRGFPLDHWYYKKIYPLGLLA